jgi:hypothetical protein
MDLADIQRQYHGLWVAVKNGAVVDTRANPYLLTLSLRERHIDGAAIFRCPEVHEPELVGLG